MALVFAGIGELGDIGPVAGVGVPGQRDPAVPGDHQPGPDDPQVRSLLLGVAPLGDRRLASFGCCVKAVLDAGALVAVDRRDRMVGAQLRMLQRQGTPLRASAAVVGQVWRDGRKQANLARVLAGVGIEPLARDDGKRIGELLGRAGSADVVDAHVALLVPLTTWC